MKPMAQLILVASIVAAGLVAPVLAMAQDAESAAIPQFQVDALWPKPLPNNWILGQVSGITVDRQDRIWVVHRPGSLTPRERAAEHNPPKPNAASRRRPSWCSTSQATC